MLRYGTIVATLEKTNALCNNVESLPPFEDNCLNDEAILPVIKLWEQGGTVPEVKDAINKCLKGLEGDIQFNIGLDSLILMLNIYDILETHAIFITAAVTTGMARTLYDEKLVYWNYLLDNLTCKMQKDERLTLYGKILNEKLRITQELLKIEVEREKLKGQRKFKRLVLLGSAIAAFTGANAFIATWNHLNTATQIAVGAIGFGYSAVFVTQVCQMIQIQSYLKILDERSLEMNHEILSCSTDLPSWNPSWCGKDLKIKDDVLQKSTNGLWNAVLSLDAVTSFKVLIKDRGNGNIMIGFAPRENHKKDGSNHLTCGWYLSVSTGGLYSQNGDNNKNYSPPIQNGTVIESNYSSVTHEISFKIDNTTCAVAFVNAGTSGKLYAAIDIYDPATILLLP